MKKKFWRGLIILLIVIQFIPYSIKNEDRVEAEDLLAVESVNPTMRTLVRGACYDCHSQEAKKPWYGYVAPIKFWVNLHVRGARQNVDFSKWGQLTNDEKKHQLEECIEKVENKEMPLKSYTWMHKDAKLTDEQRGQLVAFFNSLK